MKTWTSIFGVSEIALRIPSIIFSLITVYIVFLIIKKISNEKKALWGAAFIAFNPLLIYYAQEARMYAMVTMLIALAVYAKIRAKKMEMYIWSFLSFATFYGSIFILLALDFFNFGLYGSILILLPLILRQYAISKTLLGDVVNWKLTLGVINLKNILLIFVKLISGRIDFIKIYLVPIIIIWWMALRSGLKNKFFLRLLVLPLIFAFAFSLKVPMMQYFRFQYLIVPLSILLAIKYKNNLLFLFIFVLFSFMYLLNSNNYREDWKSMAKELPKNIYMIGSFADPINYYRKDIKVVDIKQVKPTENNFVYIPYGETIHGFDHKKIFEGLGYVQVAEKNFRGLSFAEFAIARNVNKD